MSRLGDLTAVLKGLKQVGSHYQLVRTTETIFESCYMRPVAQQAVKVMLDGANCAASQQNTRVDLENLQLVLEGLQLYTRILRGEVGHIKPKNSSEQRVASEEIDTTIRSLDLLDQDLTNEAVLRSLLFKKKNNNNSEDESSRLEDHSSAENTIPAEDETKLSSDARERRVPANRVTRVAAFGSLGIGLGVGLLAEASRRAVGISKPSSASGARLDNSLILSEANAERIVATLCKVRGAALKLGQMLSIQDRGILTPALSAIFDRVRESADFMPVWQLDKVMSGELGNNWEQKFASFEKKPFAAASIGQVHRARLHSGQQVAVKVQYPGVAKSIDSDIRNLMSLMSMLAFLPKGLFIDNIATHMKEELASECDYVREAWCGQTMKQVLATYPQYYVPTVYSELCTPQVLTTEYITGLTIDRCVSLDQTTRDYIAESILKLVFRELFLHRFMQTDPNWANFLFNPSSGKIGLLDFGATREYSGQFVNTYFKIIDGAVLEDREAVLRHSTEIGFLTGHESKLMNDAHVDSVMLLASPFHTDTTFDFGTQTITHQIQDLSGVMLRERLCPPPPEVYSLHRKLSGLFLLAGKLDARFNCFKIWKSIRSDFKPFPEDGEAIVK